MSNEKVTEMRLLIVRQPIFNRWKRVVAYELLLHSLEEPKEGTMPREAKENCVADAYLHLFHPARLAGGKTVFVPAPRSFLLKDLVIVLPPSQSVLVVSAKENSDELVSACFRFKVMGYPIAVAHFLPWQPVRSLVAIANILKVNFTIVTGAERARAVSAYATPTRKMLAERLETLYDFEEAERSGYDYFEGPFFCQPETLKAKPLSTHQFTYFRIMQLLTDADLEMEQVEKVLRTDPSLSFKLLRYINSAAVGVRHRVSSLRQALVLLGDRIVRRWLLIAITTMLLTDKPQELIVTALVRGQMCEQIANALRLSLESDPFLVGLFSVLDALLDRPLPEILEELPLSQELREALLQAPTPMGRIYALVKAYEQADWLTVQNLAQTLQLQLPLIANFYERAIRWADQVFACEPASPTLAKG